VKNPRHPEPGILHSAFCTRCKTLDTNYGYDYENDSRFADNDNGEFKLFSDPDTDSDTDPEVYTKSVWL